MMDTEKEQAQNELKFDIYSDAYLKLGSYHQTMLNELKKSKD